MESVAPSAPAAIRGLPGSPRQALPLSLHDAAAAGGEQAVADPEDGILGEIRHQNAKGDRSREIDHGINRPLEGTGGFSLPSFRKTRPATGVVPHALSQTVAGAAVGIFDPLGKLTYRVDVLRIARGLLAEGIEDPVVLPLEVFIDSHGEPPEDDGDPYPEAKPAQYPGKDSRPIARNLNALWSIFVGDFD
jgi:hypothetical protein